MKFPLLLCWLLGVAAMPYPVRAQSAVPPTATKPASPSLAYSQAAADIARLLRRATALPDAQAVALLRREGPALQAKAGQVKPAYIRWLKGLSLVERQAEQQRLEASPWYQYFSALDSGPLGVKASRNRALAEQVFNLMDFADGV
ncbi:hypothetical protein [Hymenobacter arizonensis]|uniref:Uncharacterized protein n=1 Tax=Hymenobacter arizonensis TaxID=1227077 RepID=A0A1I6BCH3_HYMAR|nr:hypothetical protein [Hymenobacter arizonensis]SFQ78643.1 hypothetical protein SAMN04515668_4347 [Hymenobacter arizonensis]